ncbi:hypothetical protein [Bacillus sp. 123MFChir2]|nr:hypothetical protein [Bacillus sp. 123MFChir2]
MKTTRTVQWFKSEKGFECMKASIGSNVNNKLHANKLTAIQSKNVVKL